MGPIHGRVLLASSAAALAGPSILLSLRSKSELAAIQDLVSKVDPARFQQVFNTGVEDAQALIDVSFDPQALNITQLPTSHCQEDCLRPSKGKTCVS